MISFIGIENNFTYGFNDDLYPWLMAEFYGETGCQSFCLVTITEPVTNLAELAAAHIISIIEHNKIQLDPTFQIASLYHPEGANLDGKANQLDAPAFAQEVYNLITSQ